MEVDDSCLSQIHSFLEDWGENKSQYYVNKIEEWLEELLSGKEIASDENTIQINLFTLNTSNFGFNAPDSNLESSSILETSTLIFLDSSIIVSK